MYSLSTLQKATIWVLPVLFAITLHEAAHAYVANRFGDGSAKMLGRLSLNPIRHIDLMGTIIAPILIALLTDFQFVFGWAKPVPINWQMLKNPRRDMAFVAVAGPLSNILMACGWAVVFKLALILNPTTSMPALFLFYTGQAGVLINLVLAILNLIPIPPLDGSRVIASLLPPKQAMYYMRLEPFGFFILLGLLLTGALGMIIQPILAWSYNIFLHI